MKCKTTKPVFHALFWALVVLVALSVGALVWWWFRKSDATYYGTVALAAAAILVGHHAAFGARCHDRPVHGAVADTLTLVGLVVLLILLVRQRRVGNS